MDKKEILEFLHENIEGCERAKNTALKDKNTALVEHFKSEIIAYTSVIKFIERKIIDDIK